MKSVTEAKSTLIGLFVMAAGTVFGCGDDVPPEPEGVVAISPSNPTTVDALSAKIDGFASGAEVEWSWTVDGTAADAASNVVLAGQTTRDQMWTATAVVMNRGEAFTFEASVLIGNSPPTVTGVAVEAAGQMPCDMLRCVALGVTDADGDEVSLSYRWFIDGVELSATTDAIAGPFGESAAATCAVVATDGQEALDELTSEVLVLSAVSLVDSDGDATCDAVDQCDGNDSSGSGNLAETYQTVELADDPRPGEYVACVLGDLPPGCELGDSGQKFSWYVDGVLQSETSSTLFVVDSGSTIECGVAIVPSGGQPGSTVLSGASALAVDVWTIAGVEIRGYLGESAAVIGDLDGDNYAEIAVSAPNTAPNGLTSAGMLYTVPGSLEPADNDNAYMTMTTVLGNGGTSTPGATGAWTTFDDICVDGHGPLQIECEPQVPGYTTDGFAFAPRGDGFGTRVRAPGDIDNDGIPDLVVSAAYALTAGQYLAGRTYVFSGPSIGSKSPDQIAVGGPGVGFALDGEHGVWPTRLFGGGGGRDDFWDGPRAGYGLATGDFDGDGYADVAIGAPNEDGELTQEGRTYVVHGAVDVASGNLAGLIDGREDAPRGWVVDGKSTATGGATSITVPGKIGAHLHSIGDFNGDGFDDIGVGHLGWLVQTTYIILGGGKDSLDVANISGIDRVVTLEPESDLQISLQSQYTTNLSTVRQGRAPCYGFMGTAGDMNGDGFADVSQSSMKREDGVGKFEFAVVYGRAGLANVPLVDSANGVDGFIIDGEPGGYHGSSRLYPSALGDIDGDGFDDLGLSVGNDLFVVWGAETGVNLTFDDLRAGNGGMVINNIGDVYDIVAGDVNGDGLSDMVLGLPHTDPEGANTGKLEVRFGRNFRNLITHRGDDGDDSLTATSDTDRMVAGAGNDVIDGIATGDVVYAGAGGDRIAVTSSAFLRVDGGRGVDTLDLSAGVALDLSSVRGRLRDIEVIDLGAGGSLAITPGFMARLSPLSNDLIVLGSGSFEVLEGQWLVSGTEDWQGRTLNVFQFGALRVLLEDSVQTRIAPSFSLETLTVNENSVIGSEVGSLMAADPDGQIVSLEILAGNEDGAFSVNGTAGAIEVLLPSLLNHEAKESFTLSVRVTDNDGLVGLGEVVVMIADIDEAPVFAAADGEASIQENSQNGTLIAWTRAVDEDEGDTLSYVFTVGNTDGALAIGMDNGKITVANGPLFNFETEPMRTLEIMVTDSTGLTSTRALTLQITDTDTVTQTFTLPFLAENRGLFDSDGSITSQVSPEQFHTIDVSGESAENDTTMWQPVDDETMTLGVSSNGSFDAKVRGELSDGYISAYVPIAVSIEFPDDIAAGQPFDITSSWIMQEDGLLWGETPGARMIIDFDFKEIATTIFSGESLSDTLKSASSSPSTATLDLEVVAEKFYGAPLDVLFPDGVVLDPQPSLDDLMVNDFAPWNDPGKAIATLKSDLGATGELVSDPNMLITQTATSRLFAIPLTLQQLLNAIGVPLIGNLWMGDVNIPFGFGRANFHYETWSARFNVEIDVKEFYVVDVTDVRAIITFENGTVVEGSLDGGLDNITVPPNEDVNGDLRVDMNIDFVVSARLYKVWGAFFTFQYESNLMLFKWTSYADELDAMGNVIGEIEVGSNQQGPMSHSLYEIPSVYLTESEWELKGFNTLHGSGGLQLQR